jgi:hypothetical protein
MPSIYLAIIIYCISFLAPTGAPKNLTESLINDRTVTIQWKPVECSNHNGEIIGYNVTYYPNRERLMAKSVVIHASDSTFTAMGLVFDTTYVFEVQAINSYGIGPPANADVLTSVLQGRQSQYCLITLLNPTPPFL